MKALQEGCGNTVRYKPARVVNSVGWISAIYCGGKAVLTWMMSVLRVSSRPWYAASWRGVLSDQESGVNKDRLWIKLVPSDNFIYLFSRDVTLYFQSHREAFHLKQPTFISQMTLVRLSKTRKKEENVSEKKKEPTSHQRVTSQSPIDVKRPLPRLWELWRLSLYSSHDETETAELWKKCRGPKLTQSDT